MQLLLFVVAVIILLPLLIVGLIVFTYRVRRISIPQKVSGTANEPFGTRLMMHVAGTRDDPVAYALAGHLPVYNKLVKFLIVELSEFLVELVVTKGLYLLSQVHAPQALPRSSVIGPNSLTIRLMRR